MLNKILSVSGKSGLFKLVSTGKNISIVESLNDAKRYPIHANDKAVALSDVSIYTKTDDVPLVEVLNKIKDKENGNKTSVSPKDSSNKMFAYLAEILPDYDSERVYASDVKKLISWYNILIENNIDLVVEKSDSTEQSDAENSEPKTEE
ncbi:MAG: DUF5606 domain-containing protein [Dysgonamonadaceae bacterium]|jgi:hypothetical protein|nr:DUF5606 domain-containing protein [Dysgonamonadaceae bacterium]MDD3308790.1 DUF5606 domain-containing protein [Dysgonamonadaceae bacterium]MDD3900472.1 DUF5606 domain-containing protein [Dysgonamonadaceae bacterium]MDD4398426.1 DUF5606 domain-containing protein [Dysgonamonadaceae bacterium]MEA5080082.1 DUF5606 domain-containing protein [Dysgonamonadaceae bacterium]